MSEYQYIEFVAIDGPVSDNNLRYMRSQSTRAEISKWRFTNEYSYGSFRGNATEMMRRGYDAHLHYANFGIRKLMFRLPGGLQCDKRIFRKYQVPDCLTWDQDDRGTGGLLTIDPEADAGMYEEDIFVESHMERLAPLREMLLGGDLRPLFLAWLACCYDDDAAVPPVPAGLGRLTRPLETLAEFYEIPSALIQVAAKNAPPAPSIAERSERVQAWVAKQDKSVLKEIVARLLSDEADVARARALAQINKKQDRKSWPTTTCAMTFGELRAAAGVSWPE